MLCTCGTHLFLAGVSPDFTKPDMKAQMRKLIEAAVKGVLTRDNGASFVGQKGQKKISTVTSTPNTQKESEEIAELLQEEDSESENNKDDGNTRLEAGADTSDELSSAKMVIFYSVIHLWTCYSHYSDSLLKLWEKARKCGGGITLFIFNKQYFTCSNICSAHTNDVPHAV